MSHTPFGYKIEQGSAVVDETAAVKIRSLYDWYLAGDSLSTAAGKSGISITHSGIARMLCNRHYLGDDYYPPIVDADTFVAAQAERTRRATMLGRIRPPKEKQPVVFPTAFYTKQSGQSSEDPFAQAEHAYNLIEREE